MSKNLELEPTNCILCNSDIFKTIATGQDYLHEVSQQTYSYVSCQKCNHLYLNPRPRISQISILYPPEYSTFTKKFAKSGDAVAWIKKQILLSRFSSIKKFLPENPKILDIGCGDLSFLISLRKIFPSAELEGLDWSFTETNYLEAQSKSIKLHAGTVEDFEHENSNFDLIIMNQLIEHLWDVNRALGTCHKALKSGGYISIETPNPKGWDRVFFKRGAWGGYYWPRHLNLFTPAELTQLVEKAGFKLAKQFYLLAPPCWIYSLQFSLSRIAPTMNLKKYVPDDSIFLLGFFAIIDSIAKLFKLPTSNQKLLARKINEDN